MSGARLTTVRLRQLADELPDRYTAPLMHLSRARVLTGSQLDRLLGQPDTASRTAERARQRVMTHLSSLGLVRMLDRRIGGARAGSAGYVHALTAAGHKLVALLTGQQPPRRIRHSRVPGAMFLAHALDIAEIYVQLTTEASRAGAFRVAEFVTEPASWWQQSGILLRPDAYTVLATAAYRDLWWLEIDRATESLPRLRDKCRDYLDHFTSGGTGPDGGRPRILFTAPDPQRADTIRAAIATTGADTGEWITVTTHDQAAHFMIGELQNP